MESESSQLKSFIERIENLERDKQDVTDDIKDVYAEAKSNGFNTKIMRALVKIRKLSREEYETQEALLETYKNAIDKGTSV